MVGTDLSKKIPMLGDLQDAELAGVSSCFSEESLAPGDMLYVEGDEATSACFLIDGELEVLKALPGGGEAQIAVIKPGSMVGEMALSVVRFSAFPAGDAVLRIVHPERVRPGRRQCRGRRAVTRPVSVSRSHARPIVLSRRKGRHRKVGEPRSPESAIDPRSWTHLWRKLADNGEKAQQRCTGTIGRPAAGFHRVEIP